MRLARVRPLATTALVAVVSATLMLPPNAAATSLAEAAAKDPSEGQHRAPGSVQIQEEFDHIGAEVHELTHDGRTSYYIDEGEPGDRVMVFLGGWGTSLQAFQLTEFARTTREELGIRVISVERNGLGASEYDPSRGFEEYNQEVLAVLDHLGIEKFSVMAISGGGIYAAHLAAAAHERVTSVHLAAASPRALPTRTPPSDCDMSLEERNQQNRYWKLHPKIWWGVPGSPVLAVPGWQAAAYLDAVRAFFLGGQLDDASALSHPSMLVCAPGAVADTSKITAPAYLYWGSADTSVPVSAMRQWQDALPNVVRATVYPDEGHTVQYRHWVQILADIAGYGDHTVICHGGRTRLVPNERADRVLARGGTLGLCAWADTD